MFSLGRFASSEDCDRLRAQADASPHRSVDTLRFARPLARRPGAAGLVGLGWRPWSRTVGESRITRSRGSPAAKRSRVRLGVTAPDRRSRRINRRSTRDPVRPDGLADRHDRAGPRGERRRTFVRLDVRRFLKSGRLS
jgi:hypothetical protein